MYSNVNITIFLIFSSSLYMMILAFFSLMDGYYENSLIVYPIIFLYWVFLIFLSKIIRVNYKTLTFFLVVFLVYSLYFAYMNMTDFSDKAGMSNLTIGSNLFGFLFGFLAITFRHKIYSWFYVFLLLLTFSRLAFLSWMISRFKLTVKGFFVLILILLLLVFLFFLIKDISSSTGFKWFFRLSDSGRVEKIYLFLEYISSVDYFKMVFGTGMGTYGYYVESNQNSYAHNVFLQVLVELGLVGLFFLIILFIFLYVLKYLDFPTLLFLIICSSGETVFENYLILVLFPFLFYISSNVIKRRGRYG